MAATSSPAHYALVAYVRDTLGQFIEGLRGELHPEHSHLAAHITILPPRILCGSEMEAIASLRAAATEEPPFEIRLGKVESFAPKTPTVFVNVEQDEGAFRSLHTRLNTGPLVCDEPWPYHPHLTIVKMPDFDQAAAALTLSKKRWKAYKGPRAARVYELTFVREGEENHWIDLATFPLTGPVR